MHKYQTVNLAPRLGRSGWRLARLARCHHSRHCPAKCQPASLALQNQHIFFRLACPLLYCLGSGSFGSADFVPRPKNTSAEFSPYKCQLGTAQKPIWHQVTGNSSSTQTSVFACRTNLPILSGCPNQTPNWLWSLFWRLLDHF